MYMRFLLAGIVTFALMLPLYSVESVSFPEVFSGKVCPLTIIVKDLTPEWSQFTLGETPQMPGGQEGGMMPMIMLINRSDSIYYTQNHTVTCAGQTYLIAYARQRKPLDPRIFEQAEPPKFEPLTLDTTLTLSLLNLRSCGSLRDIHQVNLAEVFAADENAKRKARRMESRNNLERITLTIIDYEHKHNLYFPKMATAADLKALFDEEWQKILIQPGTNEPYLPNPNLSGKAQKVIKTRMELTVMVYEASPDVDGVRLVGYCDGHVAEVPEKDWPAEKKKSGIQ